MTIVKDSGSIARRCCARFARCGTKMRAAQTTGDAEQIIAVAIETVRTLEIPHFDWFDEVVDGEVIH